MLFFQEPAPTRYDLNFNLAGFPVRVHPLFWLVTLVFGAGTGSLPDLLVWVVAVFVSLLAHELGHALANRLFGRPSHVVLYFGGGLTVPESVAWGYRQAEALLGANQEMIVSLAGPATNFLLTGLVLGGVLASGGSVGMTLLFGLLPFPLPGLPYGGAFALGVVWAFLWVNLFWGAVNLMPVYPLDGGQVARNLWLKADRWNGTRRSLWLSVVAGALVALAGLVLMHSLYLALLFGVLAFESYQALRGRPAL